jgi:hypothetical protein
MERKENAPNVKYAKINSLLIALALLLPYQTGIVDAVFPAVGTPSVLLAIIILSAGLYNNRMTFNINYIVLALTVIGVILISCLIHGYNSAVPLTILFYLVFGVALTYAAAFSFRYDDLVKYIYYIFVGSSLFFLSVGRFEALGVQDTMGISYAMLPGVFMAAHLKEIYNYTHKKVWFILSVVPFAASFFLFFSLSVRGAMMALFLYLIYRAYKSVKQFYYRTVYIVAATGLFVAAFGNLGWIFAQLQTLFQGVNINVLFIDKTIRLLNEGILLNMREVYYEFFLIRFNPLIGQGIGDFYGITASYMHNLFLQAIDELGLLYVIPFIYLIGYSVKELLLTKNNVANYYNILGLFFFLSIPRLMVSDFYWRTTSFWLLIVFIISRYKNFGKLNLD